MSLIATLESLAAAWGERLLCCGKSLETVRLKGTRDRSNIALHVMIRFDVSSWLCAQTYKQPEAQPGMKNSSSCCDDDYGFDKKTNSKLFLMLSSLTSLLFVPKHYVGRILIVTRIVSTLATLQMFLLLKRDFNQSKHVVHLFCIHCGLLAKTLGR